MRYNHTTPSNGFHKGSYTHTIYYGRDAIGDLEKDLPFLTRENGYRDTKYWKNCWDSIKWSTEKWFKSSNDAGARPRAIILHYLVPEGSQEFRSGLFGFNWNSLYLASLKYTKVHTNCQLFGNEYIDFGGPTNTDVEENGIRGQDTDYLMTIRPQLFNEPPGPPTPGMNTKSVSNRQPKYVFSE